MRAAVLLLLGLLPATAAQDRAVASLAREWLALEQGRMRFVVTVTGLDRPGYQGELVRPRWPLQHQVLRDPAGQVQYERWVHQGAGGAPGRTIAIARERDAGPWLDVPPDGRLPSRLQAPRFLLEALLVAAAHAELQAAPPPWSGSLSLDPFEAGQLLAQLLGLVDSPPTTGRLDLEHPVAGQWRFTATLTPAPRGQRVEVTVLLDGQDGILPQVVPAPVASRLRLRAPRPFSFKQSQRVLEHLDLDRDRIELTLALWWADRRGGLGGEGRLYDFEILEARWTDGAGREVRGTLDGPVPTPPRGAELRWTFVDPAAAGHHALAVHLRLRINLYPVEVEARFQRGAGDEATTWVPVGRPVTTLGELPPGVEPEPER
jgi:hypothetical protein